MEMLKTALHLLILFMLLGQSYGHPWCQTCSPPEVRRKSSGSLLARFEITVTVCWEDQQVLNSQRPLHQIFNVSQITIPKESIPSIKVHLMRRQIDTPVYLSIRPASDGIVSTLS